MKAEPWIYSLAKKMLGKEKLDIQLTDYLEEIETFADLAHGEMQKKISKLEKDIEKLKE